MSKYDAFWLSERDYRNYIWEKGGCTYDGVFHTSAMEIAVNLHEIAKQLAELNGKKPSEDESNS